MTGYVAGHAGVDGLGGVVGEALHSFFEFLQFEFEILLRGFARVFKKFEALCRHDVHVRQDGLECPTAFVSDVVLLISEIPDEVVHADVIGVLDDVMDEAFVGLAFGIEEDRTGFICVGGSHETVGGFAPIVAHTWMIKTSSAFIGFPFLFAQKRTMRRFLFCPRGTEEIALIAVRPKDFAVDYVGRYFFAASCKKKEA